MKRNIKLIQDEAKALRDSYAGRDAINRKYDKMDNSDWTLTSELSEIDGIRKTVAPDPAAALQTAVKVLSAEKPNVKVTPVGPNPDDRDTANKLERGLAWELKGAAKRSQTKLVPDIVRSAVKYAEVAVYIDYLPWRVKDWPEARKKQVLRNGQFALIPHNPTSVYPRYSPLGLEAVLSVVTMKASSAVDYYGEDAKEFAIFVKDAEKDFDVQVWDWIDYDQKGVWINTSAKDEGKEFIIIDEEREMGFIPWAIRTSGTSLEERPENQRKAFLDIVQKANLWEDMNVMGTLINSEVIAYAAAPRYLIEGANNESFYVHYGEINKYISTKPGQKVTQLNPHQIDNALTEISDRTKAKLEGATSVQVLQNLNFPAGTAYATINAVLQTAISSLQPFKVLAEMSLADIFEIMLFWIDYADGEIVSYGTGKNEAGQQFMITKEDFSINALYIDVALNASAPTDFMQRINAATLLIQMGMPKARVFEDLNISDPEQAIVESMLEQMQENEVRLKMQRREFEYQQEMMMEQQQMTQAAQGLPTGPQGVPPEQMLQGPPQNPGFSNVQGQGFDPNMGGQPAAVTNSGLTREELNQATAGGDQIVELP